MIWTEAGGGKKETFPPFAYNIVQLARNHNPRVEQIVLISRNNYARRGIRFAFKRKKEKKYGKYGLSQQGNVTCLKKEKALSRLEVFCFVFSSVQPLKCLLSIVARERMDAKKRIFERETKVTRTRAVTGEKKTKTKTNSSNSLRFNFVRETQYLLNFTKSNVIQTCHDRDWVKLNKKLDTRPNFTKFHTTRDRNE